MNKIYVVVSGNLAGPVSVMAVCDTRKQADEILSEYYRRIVAQGTLNVFAVFPVIVEKELNRSPFEEISAMPEISE